MSSSRFFRCFSGNRRLASLAVAACAALAIDFVAAIRADADTAPPSGTPATVSADGLPTWQINGVAWAQLVVGNTVYVAGGFSAARPPGSKAGVNEVPRANLLAYDITTGNLITSFNHSLNAQSKSLAVSPDHTRLYVGGNFTAVDGQVHNRIAAFNVATGALISSFTASLDAPVHALVATDSVVYAGGSFSRAGSSARSKLAAFTSAGAVTSWNPSANAVVVALTLSPDKSRLIAGGQFTTLGGQSRYGLGGVNLTTGLATTWNPYPDVRDAGPNAAVNSLSSDASNIYGTGYVFGSGGNFEGRFAITMTGYTVWLNDCHGDSYSAFAIGSVLYSVSHAHFCGNMGAFPETIPRTHHRALAETTYATGTLRTNSVGAYANFGGKPCGTQLNWYPDLTAGSYTGQNQAAWSVSGNSSYVVLGGEFPKVNNVAQQGLVRFAVASLAPNKIGPASSSALMPVASKVSAGVRLSWGTTYDIDNGVLTYGVFRDGGTTPIGSTTADSRFWTAPNPTQTFTDTSAPPGTHTYTITVRDPFGNARTSAASNAVTV